MNITPEHLPHLLRMRFVTNKTCCTAAALIDAQDSRIAKLEADRDNLAQKLHEACQSDAAEDRDHLAAQNAMLREALKETTPHLLARGMRVLNTYGCADITYEEARAQIKRAKAYEALALSNNSADWLRKHDARVLRTAITACLGWLTNGSETNVQMGVKSCIATLDGMAVELERE